MQRFIFKTLGLLLFSAAVLITARAEDIYKDVEFPKIIYQCPNTENAPDYQLIDEAGFNVILANYIIPQGQTRPWVLDTQKNQAAIPVTFRGWHPQDLQEINKYVRSKVIRRNIVEDGEYRIGFNQDYPGWTPRIRVQDDRLTDPNNVNPPVPCPADIFGWSIPDNTIDPAHDVIRYEHAANAANQIIFTTKDGNPNGAGGSYEYLYNHSTFLQPGETERPAIIRLKVKIIGEVTNSLPVLTLKLFYSGIREGSDDREWILDAEQEYTLTLDDIVNHCDYNNGIFNQPHNGYEEGDYNWACFDVALSGLPQFMPVYIRNEYEIEGGLFLFTNLLPNISVCSPSGVSGDVSYSVYIDSLEVWEEDAYDSLIPSE